MKDYDVVPMTFGIIAPSLDEVLRILERAYFQFKTALKNIVGKAEFAVQVWWDPKEVLEELANQSPEIQKLKQKASKTGILSLATRLKLGKVIQKEAEACREAYIKEVQTTLNSLACDFTFNKLIDEDMIANLSFLIEKTQEPELDKKMQVLGKEYEGKLRFKYIGPMPPYSFVNINLSLGNFELIDGARKILGLEEQASFGEIRQAYYAMSHRYHPDKHADTEEKMKKIIQAYSILENYCQSCNEFMGEGKIPAEGEARQRRQKYSFRKKEVENSLIIK